MQDTKDLLKNIRNFNNKDFDVSKLFTKDNILKSIVFLCTKDSINSDNIKDVCHTSTNNFKLLDVYTLIYLSNYLFIFAKRLTSCDIWNLNTITTQVKMQQNVLFFLCAYCFQILLVEKSKEELKDIKITVGPDVSWYTDDDELVDTFNAHDNVISAYYIAMTILQLRHVTPTETDKLVDAIINNNKDNDILERMFNYTSHGILL